MSVLGLNSKDRKSTRDKANISNPKVNRGCAPLTANRTSADCVQISLGPSLTYIPLGVYHTGGFNAMTSNFAILQTTLHATHLLKLLDNMYMDPTRTVGATEMTQDAGRTHRQTDGRSETDIPPQQLRCAGGMIIHHMMCFKPLNECIDHTLDIHILHLDRWSLRI